MTIEGSILGWKMIFLVWVASLVMTEARPTSEPVPEVVGTAMVATMPLGSARVQLSPMSSKSHIGRFWPAMQRDGLGRIERAAAAKGDDPVIAAVAEDLQPVLDVLGDRVPLDVGEETGLQPGGLQARQRVLHHRQFGQARIGDQQRLLEAELLAGVRQFRNPTDAETHGCRVIPVAAQGGGVDSP